jgi:hypothetical protein
MQSYLKAVLAFLSLLATNVATNLTTNSEAWPTNVHEWVRWTVTIVLGTWLVWQVPNRDTGRHAKDA